MNIENYGEIMSTEKLLIRPPERSLAILPEEPSSSKLGGSGLREC